MSIQTNNKQEQTASNDSPEPIVGNRGASILGPRNLPIERQNPDALIAPRYRRRHGAEFQVAFRLVAQPSP